MQFFSCSTIKRSVRTCCRCMNLRMSRNASSRTPLDTSVSATFCEGPIYLGEIKESKFRRIRKQECIPVGCVTSAAVAVSWGWGWGRGGCLPGGKGVCLGGEGAVCPGERQTPPNSEAATPLPIACWDTHPHVNRMTGIQV